MSGIRSHYFPQSIFISSVTDQAFLSFGCSIIMPLDFTEEGLETDPADVVRGCARTQARVCWNLSPETPKHVSVDLFIT